MGFRQQYDVDFYKILSPVMKMITLRFILVVVAIEDLKLIHLDMKTTFIHGDLEEEIYMDQPKGFVEPGRECLVRTQEESIRLEVGTPTVVYEVWSVGVGCLGRASMKRTSNPARALDRPEAKL